MYRLASRESHELERPDRRAKTDALEGGSRGGRVRGLEGDVLLHASSCPRYSLSLTAPRFLSLSFSLLSLKLFFYFFFFFPSYISF